MACVRVSHHGVVMVVTLDRPDSRNALNTTMVRELSAAIADAGHNGERAVVLAGAGAHFCAGADLEELAASIEATEHERLRQASELGELYRAVLHCPLFTVAAVHGAAFGGGAGLAAACDLVIAAPDARFQFSEVRLGFVPALVAALLPRRVPAPHLARLLLDPAPLSAEAAQQIGLVDELEPEPHAAAIRRAADVTRKGAASALAETKRLLLEFTLPQLDEHIAAAARANAGQRVHPECRRGLAHFRAQRSFPEWTGADETT
jgi:methylglutaconyl-CoA hydratase